RLSQQLGVVNTWKGLTFNYSVFHSTGNQSKFNLSRDKLNELYYDFGVANFDFSIGKKVMAWGVGYGFRPLDVIQQEARLQIRNSPLAGRKLINMDYYFPQSSLSFIAFNKSELKDSSQTLNPDLMHVRFFSTILGSDFYSYIQSERDQLDSLGFGLSSTVSHSLEVHFAATHLFRYSKQLRKASAELLSAYDPFNEQFFSHGEQILLGFNWTHQNNIGFIFELWHNAQGYTKKEWHHLRQLTQQQQHLLELGAPSDAVYGHIRWNSRFYQRFPMLQNNAMLRLSYEPEDWLFEFLIIRSLQDAGTLLQISLNYQINQYLKLYAMHRQWSGANYSSFKQAPMRASILAGMELTKVF
ncbi:MAG: hypothetical protein OEZ58_03695, partial [Gammaproteobacteria bacterium]|nr:hypothetical protein [Gammaproteobacteria bacterium]